MKRRLLWLSIGFLSALAFPVGAAVWQGLVLTSSNAGIITDVAHSLLIGEGSGVGLNHVGPCATNQAIIGQTGADPVCGGTGLSVTKTVRASGGAGDCTLIFTNGVLSGGSC